MHVLAEVATEVGGEEHPGEGPPDRSRHREECISRPAYRLFTKMRATGTFYTPGGLELAEAHLAEGGVLGVWSYVESSQLADALRRVFARVDVEPVIFDNRLTEERETNWLFLARARARGLPPPASLTEPIGPSCAYTTDERSRAVTSACEVASFRWSSAKPCWRTNSASLRVIGISQMKRIVCSVGECHSNSSPNGPGRHTSK